MRGVYIGPNLEELFAEEPVKRVMHDITDQCGDSLHDWAVRNTPIDTGNLRSAWYREPTRVERIGTPSDVYVSRVANDTSYADYVNYGTGIYHWPDAHSEYVIRPKQPGGLLSWVDPFTGQRVFAREVRQKGIKPQFMVESAAAKVEATAHVIAQGELEKFKIEEEMQMRVVAKAVY